MKKQDIYAAQSIGATARSGAEKVNEVRKALQEIPHPSPAVKSLLDEYPEVITHKDKVYLRPSRGWCKLTHLEIKQRYYVATDSNNEEECNRLIIVLAYLSAHVMAVSTPEKAKRKPLGWHIERWKIAFFIFHEGKLTDNHAGMMLEMAKKYGVDYYGNVYESGW